MSTAWIKYLVRLAPVILLLALGSLTDLGLWPRFAIAVGLAVLLNLIFRRGSAEQKEAHERPSDSK